MHLKIIYFVSKALAVSKKYYLKMEKICYAVVMSVRKLRHYFKAHRVRVLINQLLNDISRNRDCSGGIGKWVMKFLEHVIYFEKRSAIKLQVNGVFCTGKNRVVKITHSSSEMLLQTIKHAMIYPGSSPSSEVIALCLVV
jgi:hypothetical protein